MAGAPTSPEKKKATPAFVTIQVGGQGLKYGYQCRTSTFKALKSECGITEIAPGTKGIFFGINAPKPHRVTKFNADGTTNTSYCSDNKVNALKGNDEYQVQSPRYSLRGPTSNPNYISVWIDVPSESGSIKYAWIMPRSLYQAVGTDLGINALTANDVSNVVWGINKPKLPRATKRIGGSTRSTFFSAKASVIDNLAGKGYSLRLYDFEAIADGGGGG